MIFIRSAINFVYRLFLPMEAKIPFITSVITLVLIKTLEYESSVGISSSISFKKTFIIDEQS